MITKILWSKASVPRHQIMFESIKSRLGYVSPKILR